MTHICLNGEVYSSTPSLSGSRMKCLFISDFFSSISDRNITMILVCSIDIIFLLIRHSLIVKMIHSYFYDQY